MSDDRYLTKPGVFHDKTGLVYGRLTVTGRDLSYKSSVKWNCLCACGNLVSVHSGSLQKGLTKSCGCLRHEIIKEKITTHGMTNSPEYRIWRAMLNRCYNSNYDHFADYGGRGIKVCDRWLNSFENFYADMGPSNGLTIERINGNEDYHPSNCKWATWVEQANNRRTTKMITYKGETMPLKTFVSMFDIPYQTILNRINSGMSAEEAVAKRFLQKVISH